jgi:hypothetical protein
MSIKREIRQAVRDVRAGFADGFLVIVILVSANICGGILAAAIAERIAPHCPVDLMRALQ